MPDHPQHRKINPLAIIAVILILLALGMLFLIFAPGPRMKWALTMGEKYLTDCEYPGCHDVQPRHPGGRPQRTRLLGPRTGVCAVGRQCRRYVGLDLYY